MTCLKTVQEQTKICDFHFGDISKLFWNLSKALEDVNTGRGKAMDLPSWPDSPIDKAMLFKRLCTAVIGDFCPSGQGAESEPKLCFDLDSTV